MSQISSEEISQPQPTMPTIQRRWIAVVVTVLNIILMLLVVVGSGGLLYYAAIFHPAEIRVQATIVAHNMLIAQAQATVTNSPQYIYTQITNHPPSLDDPLVQPDDIWAVGNVGGGTTCMYAANAYHVHVTPTRNFVPCFDEQDQYRNFIFQVQMTVISGSGGTIVFRAANNLYQNYMFALVDNGTYYLALNNGDQESRILCFGRSQAAKIGKDQTNLLSVMARGSRIDMFINKHYIESVDDKTASYGGIGFISGGNSMDITDVAFTHVQVWEL